MQIILENFHKKKWAKKKKKSDFLIKKGSTTNLRSRTSEKGQIKEECLRIKFNDNGRITSYETKFP